MTSKLTTLLDNIATHADTLMADALSHDPHNEASQAIIATALMDIKRALTEIARHQDRLHGLEDNSVE